MLIQPVDIFEHQHLAVWWRQIGDDPREDNSKFDIHAAPIALEGRGQVGKTDVATPSHRVTKTRAAHNLVKPAR
jgi:hypothetical protein